MSAEVFRCVMCGSALCSVVRPEIKDDVGGSHVVAQCADCGLQQMHPPESDLAYYADDLQVRNVVERVGTPFETLLHHPRVEADRRTDRLLAPRENRSISSLLDVGGGYGLFASAVRTRVPDCRVVVLEPSQSRIQTGIEALGRVGAAIPEFVSGTLENCGDDFSGQFDVVTLFHVVEHVVDPIDLVRRAARCLRPGGLMCIEVPNAADELIGAATAFADRWYMMEHVSYFRSEQLKDLVLRAVPLATEVSVVGYQRYGLFNYISWIERNSPRGADPDLFEGTDRTWLEGYWRETRQANMTSDAIYLTCCVR